MRNLIVSFSLAAAVFSSTNCFAMNAEDRGTDAVVIYKNNWKTVVNIHGKNTDNLIVSIDNLPENISSYHRHKLIEKFQSDVESNERLTDPLRLNRNEEDYVTRYEPAKLIKWISNLPETVTTYNYLKMLEKFQSDVESNERLTKHLR